MLIVLLKFLILIGSCFVFFGPPYSNTLIHILYGKKWGNTGVADLLAMYCFYVLLMSINGITEAFVHAVSHPSQLRRSNLWMVVFSCIYLSVAILCIRVLGFGTASLVIANCINMVARIIYSTNFINDYFRKQVRKW